MIKMSAICLIDTSEFMEILNVPGKASHHKKTADLRYFNWLTSGYYKFPVVSSSLCVGTKMESPSKQKLWSLHIPLSPRIE
jgi:hypothetical protein